MSEKHDGVNKEQNLLQTIPTGECLTKSKRMNEPIIRRKSDEKRTVTIGARVTPSIRASLVQIAELEDATTSSVISWLIEAEANKRGL